jgi:multiple sugar transport system substrate-binding protein
VAPLPGIIGPGVSSLGGHTKAIAKYAENKGTALDFLKFISSPEAQKSNTLATSQSPVLESLYSDPDLVKKYPFLPTQLKSIQTAKPRPKAVEYGESPRRSGCATAHPGSDSTRCGLAARRPSCRL